MFDSKGFIGLILLGLFSIDAAVVLTNFVSALDRLERYESDLGVSSVFL